MKNGIKGKAISRLEGLFVDRALLQTLVILCLALVILSSAARAVFESYGLENWQNRLDLVLGKMCHQRPERSFNISGGTFGLCARCTCFCVGALFGMAYSGMMSMVRSRRFALYGIIVLTLPLVLDGTSQCAGLRESTNLIRSITGFMAGIGCAMFGPLAYDRTTMPSLVGLRTRRGDEIG